MIKTPNQVSVQNLSQITGPVYPQLFDLASINDNTFISVMRLKTNCRHLLTGGWATTSWRICQKTYLGTISTYKVCKSTVKAILSNFNHAGNVQGR